MTEADVSEFLTFLADDENVAASTQNQALSALLCTGLDLRSAQTK